MRVTSRSSGSLSFVTLADHRRLLWRAAAFREGGFERVDFYVIVRSRLTTQRCPCGSHRRILPCGGRSRVRGVRGSCECKVRLA